MGMKCEEHTCWMNPSGHHCSLLTKVPLKCPFYKTEGELIAGRLAAHERLVEMGREDLINKYEKNKYRNW